MRNALILLAPLLLAGCINESASYYIDGNQHVLTVRAVQNYFWNKHAQLRLIASRLPECQRQMELGDVPVDAFEIELFAHANNVYTLRADDQVWQVETQGCSQMETPTGAAPGQLVGTFYLDADDKMVFEAAQTG